jgi:hypothetical protein
MDFKIILYYFIRVIFNSSVIFCAKSNKNSSVILKYKKKKIIMPPTPKSLTAQNHHQTDPLTDSLSYMRTNSFLQPIIPCKQQFLTANTLGCLFSCLSSSSWTTTMAETHKGYKGNMGLGKQKLTFRIDYTKRRSFK